MTRLENDEALIKALMSVAQAFEGLTDEVRDLKLLVALHLARDSALGPTMKKGMTPERYRDETALMQMAEARRLLEAVADIAAGPDAQMHVETGPEAA